eukprot:RCo030957
MSTARRKVGLFGSSVNPPHVGHAAVVKFFSEKVDELWVLPVYKHIYDSKQNLAGYEERIEMARLGLESQGKNIKVTRIEEEVVLKHIKEAEAQGIPAAQVRVGTFDVLTHLKAKHPDIDFAFILGGDTYSDLRAGKWKNSDAVQSMVSLYVISRPGGPELPALGPTATVFEIPPKDVPPVVSSTLIRETLRDSKDLSPLSSILDPRVLKYIQDNKLYGYSP